MLGAFSPIFRHWKRRSHANRPGFKPRLELLEGREVPTGNVTASLSSGTLVLTGVNNASIPANNDQEVIITGSGPGSVVVQGLNGSSVNLGGGPVVYDSVTNITINMNNGNDGVTIEAVEILGNLNYNGGAGNDTITIQNGATIIGGTLNINGGAGDNTAFVGLDPADQTTVGSFTVNNSTGFDTTIVGGSDFTANKNVTINNSSGGSDTEFQSAATVTVLGSMTINNGNGDDTILIGDSGTTLVALHNVTINNNAGLGITVFDGLEHTITGNLSVTNGTSAAPDLFLTQGDTFVVTGKFTVNNGSGGSLTQFSSNLLIEIDGATSITNTAGDDTEVFGNFGGSIVLGRVTINNGADAGATFFQGGDQNIFGNLQITNGTNSAGADNFTVGGDTFNVLGNITINNGAGDTTTVLSPTTGSAAFFSVTDGAGLDDIVIVGMQLQNTTLNVGSGGSTIAVSIGVLIIGNLNITGQNGDDLVSLGGEVTGALNVNTNNGFDQVTINGLVADGSTTINTGNDDDTLTIDDSLFNGTFTTNLGNGNDTENIETQLTFFETRFVKAVNILGGAGDETVTLGIDDNVDDHVVCLSTVNFNSSTGFDQLFIGPPKSNSFSINPTLSGWEVQS